jgi:hypothetical protein
MGTLPLTEPGRVGNPGSNGEALFVSAVSVEELVSAVSRLSAEGVRACVVVLWDDIVVTVSAATCALYTTDR